MISDHTRGIHRKYDVKRLNDDTGKHRDCRFFVLDLVHDKHAVPGLEAYMESCKDEFPYLAADLRLIVDEIKAGITATEIFDEHFGEFDAPADEGG